MAKQTGANGRRANLIRDCRNDIKRIATEYDSQVMVPVEFLEAVGIWLDKALISAQFAGDSFLPEGEIDHAIRVARAYLSSDGNAEISTVTPHRTTPKEGMR